MLEDFFFIDSLGVENSRYGEICYRRNIYDFCIDKYQKLMDEDGCGECNGYEKLCGEYKSVDEVGWSQQDNLDLLLKEKGIDLNNG